MWVNQMHHKKSYKRVTDTLHVHFQLWSDPKFVHRNARIILDWDTRASTLFFQKYDPLEGFRNVSAQKKWVLKGVCSEQQPLHMSQAMECLCLPRGN